MKAVGQCPVLPEIALRRALLVGDAADIGVLDIVCLGDDDLVSIALAVLGHRVTVYDIDDYLLKFLHVSCEQLGLDVAVKERDLRDPLGLDERSQFDVFLIDPMSNRDCFDIFYRGDYLYYGPKALVLSQSTRRQASFFMKSRAL
ncbi:MAG: bis-aminopropyl spermidine synthase family protein [Myxococcota bacterium]